MTVFSRFDPSAALAAIVSCGEREIVTRTAPGLPPYLALEAMAQSCGLHLRRRHGFRVQAFLASVSDLPCPPGLGREALTIHALLTAETARGAGYEVRTGDGPAGRMLMGYNASDEPDTYFRKRFEDLCSIRSCNV